ncbi:MAG: hypothetical protein ACLGHQ_14220 [Acidimicrobiia bacterium]
MATTVKVSTETRDRIKSFGGATLEETIIEALDALDEQRFWAQAERAAAWRATLSEAERAERRAHEDALDAAFDGID